MSKFVWIVDDDQSITWVLERALTKRGFTAQSFNSAESLLDAIKQTVPDVIISDIKMKGKNGFELLAAVRDSSITTPFIIMTAFGDLDSAVDAFKYGAFEYITKPFDINDVIGLVESAISQNTTTSRPSLLQSNQKIHGESEAIQNIYKMIGRLSASLATVLIRGESGTGKELVAHAIHESSSINNQPFIAINTAAIPSELLESELFGHEKGSFTGAHAQHIGRFEQAHGGTLFLDEIGDMPELLQTRLLRVLSEGVFFRVGGRKEIRVNVRIIAATHQDLEKLVTLGQFRNDLFHRLNVITMTLPPLRERTEDIGILLEHFLNQSAEEYVMERKKFSNDFLLAMKKYPWPGNIRELRNLIQRLTILSPNKTLSELDIPNEYISNTFDSRRESFEDWKLLMAEEVSQRLRKGETKIASNIIQEVEKILLEKTLNHTAGHKINAAKCLGWGRNTLSRKLKG